MAEDLGERAWRAMLLAYNAALPAVDARLGRGGHVPLSWYDVLLELAAAPDRRLRMQELSERVVLSRTRVSRLVDEMARAGLVTKTRDETDRRIVWATLTDSGASAQSAAAPVYLQGIEAEFASHLTDAEKRVLASALLRVHAAHADVIAGSDLAPPKRGRRR